MLTISRLLPCLAVFIGNFLYPIPVLQQTNPNLEKSYTVESRFYTIRYNAESVYPRFIHVAPKKIRKSVEVGNTQLTKIGVRQHQVSAGHRQMLTHLITIHYDLYCRIG
jgi:hypothetical protein